MVTKKAKTGGSAALVAVALRALRNPAVQEALRHAPAYVTQLRQQVHDRPRTARTGAATSKVTERFGQRRLERRSADLRALVTELSLLPGGNRVGADTTTHVLQALDAIDLDLRIAAHQDFVDRKRLHHRISGELNALVDALLAPGDVVGE